MTDVDMKQKQFVYCTSAGQLSRNNNRFLITPKFNQSYNRVCVLQCNVPISYYVIQNTNNTFTLSENGQEVSISIPEGNYSIKTFCITVAELLNDNSPNGLTYTMTYYSDINNTVIDGRIYYTVNNAVMPISLIMDSRSSVYEQFGFNSESTNSFSSGLLESTNVCKFVPEDAIHLHCDAVDASYCGSDILLEMYFSNNIPLGVQSFTCPDVAHYARPCRVSRDTGIIEISITSEDDLPLYLNGLNISMSLLFFNE